MAKTFDYTRDYIIYSNYSDSHNGFIFSTVYLQRGLEVCDYIEIFFIFFIFFSAKIVFMSVKSWLDLNF